MASQPFDFVEDAAPGPASAARWGPAVDDGGGGEDGDAWSVETGPLHMSRAEVEQATRRALAEGGGSLGGLIAGAPPPPAGETSTTLHEAAVAATVDAVLRSQADAAGRIAAAAAASATAATSGTERSPGLRRSASASTVVSTSLPSTASRHSRTVDQQPTTPVVAAVEVEGTLRRALYDFAEDAAVGGGADAGVSTARGFPR